MLSFADCKSSLNLSEPRPSYTGGAYDESFNQPKIHVDILYRIAASSFIHIAASSTLGRSINSHCITSDRYPSRRQPYCLSYTDMAKPPPLTQDMGNLQTLQSLLLPSSLVDPVFVAIDFERPQFIINHFQHGYLDTQVGLAILDTRCLSLTSKFTTFNFITGEDTYFEESAPLYHWGTAEKISTTSMLSKIEDCLHIYQNRNIILVGHGFANDLAALKALGFDFQKNQVIEKLDTYLLARDLQMGHLTLKNLLMEVGYPCNLKFHNAGNDANFTLRALLLLGIKAIRAAVSNETSERERVRILWWITMEEVLSRKRKKHIQRKAAKTRTLEEQEEIRAKRQQHRESYVSEYGAIQDSE
jgi:hypothetical protein